MKIFDFAKYAIPESGKVLSLTAMAGSVSLPTKAICLLEGESISFKMQITKKEQLLEIEEIHRRTDSIFAYILTATENGKPEQNLYFRDYEPCADTWNGYFVQLPGICGCVTFKITVEYGMVRLCTARLHETAILESVNENMLAGFFMPRLYSDNIGKTVSEVCTLRDTVTSGSHMKTAIGCEIPYMNRSNREIVQYVSKWLQVATEADTPLFINLNTWWGGTPGGPDGNGGYFGDSEYQQVAFDPKTRKYTASVPNMWSNTPWLTMNHPRLNEVRRERLGVVIRLIQQFLALKSCEEEIPSISLFLDNEPTYWAAFAYGGDADAGGDFSSYVRDDAAKDNVFFRQGEPLGIKQREWLLKNLNRYMSELSTVCADQKQTEPILIKDGKTQINAHQITNHIYSHIFPFACYPFMDPNRLQWEFHITSDLHLGIESSSIEDSRIYDYAVRLGCFGNINAERACIRDYSFFKQNYCYGADICMIFNYQDADAREVNNIGKDFDKEKVHERDYPIPVRCFNVFQHEANFSEFVHCDNIIARNCRNRRILQPEHPGRGTILIRAGKAEEYGKSIIIESWMISHKDNGNIYFSVGTSPDYQQLAVCLPEHSSEGSPLVTELSLFGVKPEDTVWLLIEINTKTFDVDWALQNCIWHLRLMRHHSSIAGHANGFCFTASQLRKLNRMVSQRAEPKKKLLESEKQYFCVADTGMIGKSGYICCTDRPVILEILQKEQKTLLTGFGQSGTKVLLKKASAEKTGFNSWCVYSADTDAVIVIDNPVLPREISGRYGGISQGILKIYNQKISQRGWQPFVEIPVSESSKFRLRQGRNKPYELANAGDIPKGTDCIIVCDKSGVVRADFTILSCFGTVTDVIPATVYPNASNAKFSIQNGDIIHKFTIGRECKLEYCGAPNICISGCPDGNPFLQKGKMVIVRYSEGDNSAILPRALQINETLRSNK